MSRRYPTLDEFIKKHLITPDFPKNSYVQELGFRELYVRMTTRYINDERLAPVLDIAKAMASKPGKGAFTKLLARLREQYPTLHIFAEQVLNDRFALRLEKLGFTKLNPNIHGESYFLKARARGEEQRANVG